MRRPKMFFVPAILVILSATGLLNAPASLAEPTAIECRTKPGSTARPGTQWYYRVNPTNNHAMLKGASRGKFDIVLAWAIDRLGRSLIDLLGTIQHLEACGADLYIDQQNFDTSTPMGKLVFQVTGAFAEFERSLIRQRVRAGLKRAVAQGTKLGRPKVAAKVEAAIRATLAGGTGMIKAAKTHGVGVGTVQRIAREGGRPFDEAASVAV
jgi:Resolvase, N terminal domain